ncbi:periplasmic component of amino acid ABC-type transporter/signal transduction system [Rheinheimera sp. A13L]|uniref:substrate-binding periplasmic protein n=1 Tax=Rheinheimera sp. A13L TaxID=506534 RepID=UPI0002124AE4|nr:transporter substrate-binding domain-containing protein [Rheinheimera sp. A13L]EGM76465.1 periplasmic component of amino acid ABC-type transporter/signal transduction system [Rheinheimera sp. A13L]
MKVLWLCCVLFCFAVSAAMPCPLSLRMAYNNDWLPYVQLTDETVTGSDIELVRSLIHTLGSSLQLVRMSEQRALQQIQQGELDLVFAASYTKERAGYAYFSLPYREENITAVLSNNLIAQHPELQNSTDFYQLAAKRWSGAVNTAGYYGDEFEHFKQNEGQSRLFHVAEEFRRLQMVAQGRAQYSIVDRNVAHYHIRQHKKLSQLRLLPFLLHNSSIHLMLSKKTVPETCVEQMNLLLKTKFKNQIASEQ